MLRSDFATGFFATGFDAGFGFAFRGERDYRRIVGRCQEVLRGSFRGLVNRAIVAGVLPERERAGLELELRLIVLDQRARDAELPALHGVRVRRLDPR